MIIIIIIIIIAIIIIIIIIIIMIVSGTADQAALRSARPDPALLRARAQEKRRRFSQAPVALVQRPDLCASPLRKGPR